VDGKAERLGMLQVRFAKSFTKQFNKLPDKLQEKSKTRIYAWKDNPRAKQFSDHALTGKYKGYRSINIAGDLRAVYLRKGDTVVIFTFIGSHSQLYG